MIHSRIELLQKQCIYMYWCTCVFYNVKRAARSASKVGKQGCTSPHGMLSLVGHNLGFGRPRGHREGVWKGLGWPKGGWRPGNGSNMGPTWAKLEPTWSWDGPNLSQLAANSVPCWVQIGSSRPSCTNLEAILNPLGVCTTSDATNNANFIKDLQKLMLSKLLESKKHWKT